MEAIETNKHRAMVFVGGDINVSPPPDPSAFVVGCDSGYDHAATLGHHIDLLIGDLDSISEAGIRSAESPNVTIERHPQDKDATDFELAIDACIAHGFGTIDIYGGEGGRLDHLLGIATAITADRWKALTLRWHTAGAMTTPLIGPTEVSRRVMPGTRISLIAVTDCTGITTTGTVWPLGNATLHRGSSQGISNLAEGETITIALVTGALLVTFASADAPEIAPAREGTTNQ